MKKKDQYTVVLEDIRDDFKVFGESLQFVRADVSNLKKDVSVLKKDISGLKKDMSEVKTTLNSHSQILNSHTEMIGQLMVDMTEVKNGLKSKVGQDDFARLEKRVVRLETKVR